EALRDQSLNVRILTGDGWAGAHAVLDLAETEAELTPEQKHRAVESLRGGEPGYARPLFVGDGLNDAAAMAASHVSIALAGGSSVAAETASATLHGDDLTLIPRAVGLARHAVRIIRSNLHWAVAYNLLGILAAATGHLHPVVAVLLMACSSAFVSWRSFRLAKPPALPRRAATREERIRPGRGVLRMFGALHVAGMLGQGWLLAILAGRPVPGTLAAFAAAAVLLLAFWRRMPPWLDMIFAMVTLGGLGMNFGWWMDFGFQPAVGGCPHCSPEQSSLWMNTGMLLLGVPAMFLVRHTWERFRWRKWCCGGMVVLGIPGMLLGMLAGSVIAAEWLPGAVVGHYLLMMLGMCLGMLLPHALEFALPRRARS
ncbi:MAG: HAD-IC family P-type ATPase, partial [Planctomycetota bacterium]